MTSTPDNYRELAIEAARASLAGPANSNNHNTIGDWLIEKFGKNAIPHLAQPISPVRKITCISKSISCPR